MAGKRLALPGQGRSAAARTKSGRPGGKYDIFIADRDALAFFFRGPGRAGPQLEERMRYKEEKMDQWTTRQYWAEEDADEALFDGWKACLARRLEKEDADINNNLYRRGEAGK